MNHAFYTLVVSRANKITNISSAHEAGVAFFNEDRTNQPAVIHAQEDPAAPGGRFARVLADTQIQGIYPNGEKKFVKTLPATRSEDAQFRAGYWEALEASVAERLKLVGLEESTLSNHLQDDLEALTRRDPAVAMDLWRQHAPDLVGLPECLSEAAQGALARP